MTPLVGTARFNAGRDAGKLCFSYYGEKEFAILVLPRREGQTVVIETRDVPIRVSLEMLKGNQARGGIDAPESAKILGEELLPDAEGI